MSDKAKSVKVQLKIKTPSEFNMDITAGGQSYHVQTERGDTKTPIITTHIYCKGEIVYSERNDYSNTLSEKDFDEKLREVMRGQHKRSIDLFIKRIEDGRKKIEYFEAIKKLLMRKNHKQAFRMLNDALEELPDDPFIMSYYGYLNAVVEKKCDEGIALCRKALEKLDPVVIPGEESLYTTFYLNLGRAYLAKRERKSAIDAFNEGLNIDKDCHDLTWELRKLGVRKRPVIPLLSRDNPLNKYLGKLRTLFKGK